MARLPLTVRGLIVGDVHLADRPPSIRTEDYAEQILAKLRQTVKIAAHHEVDFVAWAGDVFHVKAPGRTSHWLVQQAVDVGQGYGVPWLIVPGNHDMQHDRLDSLDRAPLGVLFKSGAIPLIGTHVLPKGAVFGIPWLWDWKVELPRWLRQFREDDLEPGLLVTHAPLTTPGRSLPFQTIDSEDWAELAERPGADVYYGHMHDPDGEFEAGGMTFANWGAISRGSLHESTLRRRPAVSIYDTEEKQRFRRLELEHLPAERVFRLDVKRAETEKAQKLDEFLEHVESTNLTSLTVEQVVDHVSKMGLSERTLKTIEECLEVALHS